MQLRKNYLRGVKGTMATKISKPKSNDSILLACCSVLQRCGERPSIQGDLIVIRHANKSVPEDVMTVDQAKQFLINMSGGDVNYE